MKSQKVATIHLGNGTDFQVTQHVVSMEKVSEYYIKTNALNAIFF